MNLFRYTLFVFYLASPFAMEGQSLKAFVKAAEEAEAKDDYYSALVYYQNALEFDTTNLEYLYKSAESARKFNAFTLADSLYFKVFDGQSEGEYPLSTYYLAKMKQRLGDYDGAIEYYGIYLSEYEGDDEHYTMLARKYKQASEWAKTIVERSDEGYKIERINGEVNSPFTEFGAIQKGDSMFFSSMRFDNPDDDYIPTRPLTHIMISDSESTLPLSDSINVDGKHTAHTAFNHDLSRVYYTICDYLSGRQLRCELFYRDIEDGVWGESFRLPDTINLEGYTATQPNVGIDPTSQEQVLYFVSDRDGGLGGLDIWAAQIKEDGEFGHPYNIESINSSQDDITPFYHHTTNTIYFSSEGYLGLGGFDVYKAYLLEGGWGGVTHLGYPLNSSYDDIYYTLSDDSRTALYSSNREKSLFVDPEREACCFDIYEVQVLPFINLITQNYDAKTGSELEGVAIQLIDLADPENLIVEHFDPDEFEYEFPLDRDRSYRIIASKEGYFPDTLEFNTINLENEEDIVKKIYLKRDHIDLDVLVFDSKTRQPLLGATVTILDSVLLEGERMEKTNLDSNIFNFPIQRGRSYRILASRKGYSTGTEVLEAEEFENLDRVERRIYLDIGSLGDFLPLVLYFDNDVPDRRSWSRNTDVNYSETYPQYYQKKEKFVEEFTDPIEGEEKEETALGLSRFFETELKKGKEDLDNFMELLLTHLKAGDPVDIYLKGYASPRASREYNFVLGLRRVNSVRNELLSYSDGVFKDYLDDGQLTIKEQSFGSTNAPPDVIGDLDDERNSIYSLGASKERRVEIIQIEVGH